ncbi:2-oxoglutarate and iron-dependent oxygenase domain-containing protein [Agriterribacter sp.]|uniref:2-oxoglutarate and iron-dependent oxygenase domain-containing protein n=1 Tax=Agriterribacter sp. TaxID=2821509 RepID=UPI002BC06BF8|nr:2-oxoglutarate and iron-dependent oxygenase domain-containing protein [Agriterribacter sp.]HRP55887.1 2-oxoglutarate and iron-dependent oxygenase domain-containing protein [Agriterribacter sp.]
MHIPVVDLSNFTGGDGERKKDFVQQLGKAYEEVGFVAVKNNLTAGEYLDEKAKENRT